jgi:hypothetical protein
MASRAIEGQVHEHLVELAWVGHHRAESRPGPRHDLDVFSDEPAEHRRDPGKDRLGVERPGSEDLAPREGQELGGQLGRPGGGSLDLDDVLGPRVVGLEFRLEDFGVAGDGRQQIVEVVRHSARKPPDRLELLRLHKLSFERPLAGDIAADDDAPDHVATLVAARADHEVHVALGPVFAPVARWTGPRHALQDGLSYGSRGIRRLRLGSQEVRPSTNDLFRAIAGDPGESSVGVDDPTVPIGDDDRLARLLHYGGQPVALGLCGPPRFLAADHFELERYIVGQPLEQLDFYYPEGVQYSGIDVERADRLTFDHERQRDGGLVAALLNLGLQGPEHRIGVGIRDGHRLKRLDCRRGHSRTARIVADGQVEEVEIALHVSGGCDRPDLAGGLVDQPNPGHAEAAALDGDAAGGPV